MKLTLLPAAMLLVLKVAVTLPATMVPVPDTAVGVSRLSSATLRVTSATQQTGRCW